MPNLIRYYSILFIFVFSGIAASAQLSYMNFNTLTRTATKRSTTKKVITSPAYSKTASINSENVCEAYPYLSADGLRLYFTSNREGGHGRFFISTRTSTNEPFSEPVVLSQHLTDGYYCSSLTADELTICMVKNSEVFISVRKSVNDEFGIPVKVKGINSNYHFAPAISPNGKELIMVESKNSKDHAIYYRRTATYSFVEKGELKMPDGAAANPGQFSKDGLSYYTSVENEETETLVRFTRSATNQPFTNPQKMGITVKDSKKISQPTVSGDGSIIMCITSPGDLWESDDILLIYTRKDDPRAIDEENIKKEIETPRIEFTALTPSRKHLCVAINNALSPMNASIKEAINSADNAATRASMETAGRNSIVNLTTSKVYPAPFKSDLYIELKELPEAGGRISISDLTGKTVSVQSLTGLVTHITINNVAAGTYLYQVVNGKGAIVTSGKIVKL